MKKIIPALFLSAFASPVFADDGGFYGSLDLGQVTLSGARDILGPSGIVYSDFSKPGTLRIGGGFHFNRFLDIDAGYMMNQDSIAADFLVHQTLHTSSIVVAAVGYYPVSETIDLFGKLGVANNKLKYSAPFQTQISGLFSGSATKTNVMFGIGVQHRIDRQWSIRAQYENFGKTTVTATSQGQQAPWGGAKVGMSAITVGNVYNF